MSGSPGSSSAGRREDFRKRSMAARASVGIAARATRSGGFGAPEFSTIRWTPWKARPQAASLMPHIFPVAEHLHKLWGGPLVRAGPRWWSTKPPLKASTTSNSAVPPTILTPSSDADAAPSLFTALQETLGLRPQHQKVPVDVVAVDRVDRVPTEN